MIINGAGPGQTTLTMDPDMASRIGAALIGIAGERRIAGSLFTLEPMMTVANPGFEVLRSDTGQVFVAFQPGKFRPIIFQLDPIGAQQLSDSISGSEDKREFPR
jgi:hypothetical protein